MAALLALSPAASQQEPAPPPRRGRRLDGRPGRPGVRSRLRRRADRGAPGLDSPQAERAAGRPSVRTSRFMPALETPALLVATKSPPIRLFSMNTRAPPRSGPAAEKFEGPKR